MIQIKPEGSRLERICKNNFCKLLGSLLADICAERVFNFSDVLCEKIYVLCKM